MDDGWERTKNRRRIGKGDSFGLLAWILFLFARTLADGTLYKRTDGRYYVIGELSKEKRRGPKLS
jgi:hypothetical protein